MIESPLDKPYWIVDILPEQVPAYSLGQYFAVEKYYLTEPRITAIRRKQIGVILKLNCYYDIYLGDEMRKNPPPEALADAIGKTPLQIILDGALIVTDPGDTYMTVYNPGEGLLERIRTIAAAEGLFVWQPPGAETGT